MIELAAALLYPDYIAESCNADLATPGFVFLAYSKTKKGFFGRPVNFQDAFWFERANLRWFAKALHACATYDRANATEYFPEAVLTRGNDSLCIGDNGADYGILVRVENSRGINTERGSASGGYSFYVSLPLAELLANELLALSDGEDEAGAQT